MQLVLVTRHNARRHGKALDAAYRLRHRVFVDKFRWEALRRPDGREIDQFDGEDGLYFIGLVDGTVVCNARLLPTTKPHLLSDVYPEILDGAEVPRGPDIYEWTRTCFAPERGDSLSGMSMTAGVLFTGVVEACLKLGIRGLTVETDPLWVTRFLELGFDARPLALPVQYDGRPLLAIWAGVHEGTLTTLRQRFGLAASVLDDRDAFGSERDLPGIGEHEWEPAAPGAWRDPGASAPPRGDRPSPLRTFASNRPRRPS